MDPERHHSTPRWSVRRRFAAVALALVTTALASGCTDRTNTERVGSLPVMPTAYPTGPASTGSGVAQASEDIQAVSVTVSPQGFETDIYSVQNRPMRLEVWATGGPYTLAIDELMQPQQLDPNGATILSLSPPRAGEFTMRLSGAHQDTATLNVRAAGQR